MKILQKNYYILVLVVHFLIDNFSNFFDVVNLVNNS